MLARRAAALVAIALLTACGSATTGPGASSDTAHTGDTTTGTVPVTALSQIAGTYTAVNTAQSPKPLVKGRVLILQIKAESIIVRAGCNTMSGPAKVADSRLVITDLAITEMACAAALTAQDTWLGAYLATSPRVDWSGSAVSLVWDDGWLGFDRSVAPAADPTSDPDTPVSNSFPTG